MGVENAALVCCFLTSDYEQSDICRLELQYACKRQKRIIPLVLDNESFMNRAAWLEPIIGKLLRIDFRDASESKFRLKARELLHRINDHATNLQHARLHSSRPPTYLFEMIKYDYVHNSRIERFMNPAKTFPIEQSYINLAMVESKEHQDNEKKLRTAANSDAIMGTYEGMYGSKTSVKIKDIFKPCLDSKNQILVLGPAGIGKSTFCRYVAHRWATGKILMEYDLVALIPLCSLTEHRYPPSATYSPCDIIIAQCLQNFTLSDLDKELFKQQFSHARILWLLDGYDERVQNVPFHLQHLFEQLLNTTNHIITSRPFQNTLSDRVHIEIIGFTDQNIPKYVERFFVELRNEPRKALAEIEKLIRFLESNPRLWGIAHIPINLELICSVWSNNDWSETKTMTTTLMYDKVVEWMCRRYLEKYRDFPSVKLNAMRRNQLYKKCKTELEFLESLAFLGVVKNTIILRPKLVEDAEDESGCSTAEHPNLLNIGILKSFSPMGTGTQVEVDKDHYFVHLSFQEYFAARYLVNDFKHDNGGKAIKFIQDHKYQQRLRYVLTFMSGLLADYGDEKCINAFWDTIMGHPVDLIGIQHMDLILTCFDETGCIEITPHQQQLIPIITQLLEQAFKMKHRILRSPLLQSLKLCTGITNHPSVQKTFAELLTTAPQTNIRPLLLFIGAIRLLDLLPVLEQAIMALLDHEDQRVRRNALNSLITMSKQTKISTFLDRLVAALGHKDSQVRSSACDALCEIGESAATTQVLDGLVAAIDDEDENVRSCACQALGQMGEKAAVSGVIYRLVTAISDDYHEVRVRACEALGQIGENAATIYVIDQLVTAIGDTDAWVRSSACSALHKMSDKVATAHVIDRLVTALGDDNIWVRSFACDVLGNMAQKVATVQVNERLMTALSDEDALTRSRACGVFDRIGERAAMPQVINRLVSALHDENHDVRLRACFALFSIHDNAAIESLIDRLVTALDDDSYKFGIGTCEDLESICKKRTTAQLIDLLLSAFAHEDSSVRSSACDVLGRMGKVAMTIQVVDRLVKTLGDSEGVVRSSAYNALRRMGQQKATIPMIDRYMLAPAHDGCTVRNHACDVLGEMTEKSATADVIQRLMTALGDKDSRVRSRACGDLRRIGEKIATPPMIDAVVTIPTNGGSPVRSHACDVLGDMVEKSATADVIDRFSNIVGDGNCSVRSHACEAISRIGEGAITTSMLDRLVKTLGGKDSWARNRACDALRRIGQEATTTCVTDRLVIALRDRDSRIRGGACEVLGMMNLNAATSQVIDRLVHTLGDSDSSVRSRACDALSRIGEEAVTTTVIDRLVNTLTDRESSVRESACNALRRMSQK